MHLAPDAVVGARTLSSLVLDSKVAVRSRPAAVGSSYRRYTVRPGDSLTAVAMRFHVSLASLARANHLDPSKVLLIGKRLKIPGAARVVGPAVDADGDPREARPLVGAHERLAAARPCARVDGVGLPAERRFQAGARGVLQTLPMTRDYVEEVLLGRPVARTVDGDIEVGVAYLRHLLGRFAGNEHLALAAWYQGEAAVRRSGVFKVTKPFVENVLALKARM